MTSIWLRIKRFFNRKLDLSHRVGKFIHENPDLLVIVGDPKTDSIITGYRNFITATAIKPDLKNHKTRSKVIKEVLTMSRLDHAVDRFLFQIDGAVWNLAKAVRDKRRKAKLSPEVVSVEDMQQLEKYVQMLPPGAPMPQA